MSRDRVNPRRIENGTEREKTTETPIDLLSTVDNRRSRAVKIRTQITWI